MQTIITERLRLEPLDPEHADLLYEGLSDEELYRYITEAPPKSAEALRERYQELARRTSPDGRETWLNWAVARTSGGYVGWVQATVRRDGSAEIAYVFFRSAWGRGYAREAVEGMIAHLREIWSIKICRASVDGKNVRSLALLEALDFRRSPKPEAGEDLELYRQLE